MLTPLEHPALQAAARAVARGFGKPPVFIREGGSIPFVATIVEQLRLPAILLGAGLPDEHTHAPNEFFHLENFYRGMHAVAYLGTSWPPYRPRPGPAPDALRPPARPPKETQPTRILL